MLMCGKCYQEYPMELEKCPICGSMELAGDKE